MEARKPRSDSKLDSMPPARVAELRDGLLGNWSHQAASEWLEGECGITTSGAALTAFYQRHCAPVVAERKQFAAMEARILAKLAYESEAFDAAAIGQLKEYAYRLMRDPSTDQEAARKWMETLIKAKAAARDERRLALLEAKAAQADQATAVANDGKLSEEEKAATLKQIFRMG